MRWHTDPRSTAVRLNTVHSVVRFSFAPPRADPEHIHPPINYSIPETAPLLEGSFMSRKFKSSSTIWNKLFSNNSLIIYHDLSAGVDVDLFDEPGCCIEAAHVG